MKARVILASVVSFAFMLSPALAAEKKEVRYEDGRYMDQNDEPMYNIKEDGTVDWYTYSGFRRYHAECHVCHGPDGLGSTYAPALVDSLKTIDYTDFIGIVAVGRESTSANQTSKMPGFGENVNVYCYMDDIYVYLLARSNDAIPRGRPRKRDKKPKEAKQYEDECRDGK